MVLCDTNSLMLPANADPLLNQTHLDRQKTAAVSDKQTCS
jgi:hypothetical protein